MMLPTTPNACGVARTLMAHKTRCMGTRERAEERCGRVSVPALDPKSREYMSRIASRVDADVVSVSVALRV
jgi:hypothetical protein